MNIPDSYNNNDNDPFHEPKKRPVFYRTTSFWLIILFILIVIIFIQHNPFSHKHHKATPEVPVVVGAARSADVSVYLSELGGVTPVTTVTVKTQINGQLWKVLFKEGQMVKAGQLIAEIDPRPYQAQLVEFEGQLTRDKALLANALLDLQRYQTLWKQNSVAKQVLDTQVSLVQQDEGTVRVDEGLIAGVKVNLIYCEIISPVDGRVGLRLVDPGNFVQTSDTTGIAVIDTLNPIDIVFSIPEDSISDVLDQINAGQTLTVNAFDRLQNKLLATGNLLTIDNQIDPTTGMVKMKAEFQNKELTLFPNQFVNVKLLVKILHNAVVVPTAGIQHGTKNNFVYVLNNNNTVSVVPVVLGVASGDETTITSGVKPGQSIVIEGADKLTDGAAVTISDPSHPAPALAHLTEHAHRRFAV